MRTSSYILVVALMAIVSPAQAQFFSGGSRGGGSYGYGGGDSELAELAANDPSPFGIITGSYVKGKMEIANRMLDQEQNRGEVHYSQLPGTNLGQSIISIKMMQQTVAAQQAAEAKADEAAEEVSKLAAEVGELKALCQQLLAENQRLKDENTALKAENARLKAAVTAGPRP